MNRLRGDNGQFQKMNINWCVIVKIILFILLSIPLFYYLLIKKNLFAKTIELLEYELGCNCNCSEILNGSKMNAKSGLL